LTQAVQKTKKEAFSFNAKQAYCIGAAMAEPQEDGADDQVPEGVSGHRG
jgi:hypothetical protein